MTTKQTAVPGIDVSDATLAEFDQATAAVLNIYRECHQLGRNYRAAIKTVDMAVMRDSARDLYMAMDTCVNTDVLRRCLHSFLIGFQEQF
jgi:hypothetical protein